MSEVKLSISNDLMLETAYAFNQISVMAEELAMNVSDIELSENDKKISNRSNAKESLQQYAFSFIRLYKTSRPKNYKRNC